MDPPAFITERRKALKVAAEQQKSIEQRNAAERQREKDEARELELQKNDQTGGDDTTRGRDNASKSNPTPEEALRFRSREEK